MRLFTVLDKRLSEVEYLAGDHSIADVGAVHVDPLHPPTDHEVHAAAAAGPPPTGWPTPQYQQRPAVQKGLRVPRSAVSATARGYDGGDGAQELPSD